MCLIISERIINTGKIMFSNTNKPETTISNPIQVNGFPVSVCDLFVGFYC